MKKKVILILVDGMRPDAILSAAGNYLSELATKSTYCYNAQTIMPSYTLPCHTSLFFSLTTERHGITTNTWMPMARPVESIGDIVAKSGKKAAMFYNWDELRDLNKPGSLEHSYYDRLTDNAEDCMSGEREMTRRTIEYINKEKPDFVFLYLGYVDVAGHDHGWMSDEYMKTLQNSIDCIQAVRENIPSEYHVIITADHGGHDRSHGYDIPEDMTIPLVMNGPTFQEGKALDTASIMDIAPTIAHLLELTIPREWEGHSLL